MGSLYRELKKYDLAEQNYKLAIENGNNESLNELGIVYDIQGKYDLAEKYWKLGVEKNDAISIEYLKMALENGYEDAKQPLKDLEDMGY